MKAAAGLLCVLLIAALIAVARPAPGHASACTLDEAASIVATRGLAFVGPPWLGEYLLISQRPDSVVAISAPVRIGLLRSLANSLYPRVALRPDATFGTGYKVNVEYLLRRRPAVAVQSFFAPRLLSLDLCTVRKSAEFGTPATIAAQARVFATIAGSPAHADVLVRHFDAAMTALASDLAAMPAAPIPRVLNLGITRWGGIFAQSGKPGSDFIARAGGVNALPVSTPLGQRLDAERLFALDPDDIFLLQALAGDTPGPDALRASRLGHLRAIATGRVFTLPPDWILIDSVVATPSYERWVAERLHPSLAGSARASLRQAFADDLGVDLPSAWVDAALAEGRR